MVRCPVCNHSHLGECVRFEMLINGRLTHVCEDCYRDAYRRTNLHRVVGRPRKSFF